MTLTRIPPSVDHVDRIERPSRKQFEEDYVAQRKPVIITGIADQWEAFSKWTPDYLKSVAGDTEVGVHYSESGDFHSWYNDPRMRRDRRVKFGDVIDIMTGPAERAHKYYMTEHNLGWVSNALLGDLSVGSLIDETPLPGVCTGPTLFLGQDTSMPSHFHATTEAFMCQLQGTKTVLLHGPEQTPCLYPHPWFTNPYNFSRVNWFRDHIWKNVDYEKFPLVEKAEGIEFQVHPGEILFIPVHWWHVTTVKGYQLSITYFWRSDRARWCFPTPGREVAAHEAFLHFKRMCEALGAPLPQEQDGALTLYEELNL